ncbi:hypothetical protein N9355_10500 [Crocinitomicaceae bacterium]|nr:hypothetical protein [Crocinitomicaceae bacterium]
MITADDFGICDAIDDGIYDCIEKNDSLDCVDVFVNYESTEYMKLNASGNRKRWDKSSEERIKAFVDKYRSRIESGNLKNWIAYQFELWFSYEFNFGES